MKTLTKVRKMYKFRNSYNLSNLLRRPFADNKMFGYNTYEQYHFYREFLNILKQLKST